MDSGPNVFTAWWAADEDQAWRPVKNAVEYILDRQKGRLEENWRHLRMFQGIPVAVFNNAVELSSNDLFDDQLSLLLTGLCHR